MDYSWSSAPGPEEPEDDEDDESVTNAIETVLNNNK